MDLYRLNIQLVVELVSDRVDRLKVERLVIPSGP